MNVISIFVFVLEILVDRLQQNYLNKCANCVCRLVKRTQLYAFIWKKPFRTYLKSSFTAKEQCINLSRKPRDMYHLLFGMLDLFIT